MAKDYSAGASVIHFLIFFQCIAAEGEPPGEEYESFVQLGEGLLGGTPTMQRLWSRVLWSEKRTLYGGSELEHVYQRRVRYTKELGPGLNERGVPAKVNGGWHEAWWGPIHTKEVAFTFCRLTGRRHFKNHSSR